MMRKAFTLVEMLLVICVTPAVMIIVSGVFATFIRDIPRETRVVQQNTTVQDMLVQLRRDVDWAVSLPQRFGGAEANDATLLIEQPQAVVGYRFEAGRTVRTLLKGQGPGDANEQRVWRMPDAVVTCRPWMRGDAAYAVEVHACVQQWVGRQRKNQLANSYVFFIHALGKGGEVQ